MRLRGESCPLSVGLISGVDVRILVVEDEPTLAQSLLTELQSNGHAVDWTADGEEATHLGCEVDYDLAIVDLGLPGRSGLEVITEWRQQGRQFPILILTARDHWQDKVQGLEAGADDYMAKPFHLQELLARVNALLRRAAGQASRLLSAGCLTLDSSRRTASLAGQPLTLTSYEFNTLLYLLLHAGQVVSKTELTEHLYAQDYDRDSNVIEVFIGRLRKKLAQPGQPAPITTLRGQGYRFNWPLTAGAS